MKTKKVLMVHGITDTGDRFQSMSKVLKEHGFQTYTIDLIPNIGTADLRDLAKQVQSYIKNEFKTEEKIILIGFSMGGLVTRYYLQRLNGIKKVDKYITISAPNHGTYTAYLLPLKGVKQMRPHSDFLQDLNQDVSEVLNNVETLCLWTPFDLMIRPANSSLLGIGKEVSFPVLIHRWMLDDNRVLQEVVDFLND